MAFTPVNDGDLAVAPQVQQIIDALQGVSGAGQPISLTSLESDTDVALTIQNLGTGGALSVFDSGGVEIFTVDDSGVTFGGDLIADTLTLAKGAAPSAPGSGLVSLYGTTLGGLGLMANGESTARLVFDSTNTNIHNVKHYGAKGDATTDDTTAIAAAYAAIPSVGGVLYFPPGSYKVTSLTFSTVKNVAVVGAGVGVSTIFTASTGSDMIAVSGASIYFELRDVTLFSAAARTATTYLLSVTSASRVWITDARVMSSLGRCLSLNSCGAAYISNTEGLSTNGTTGDCVLRSYATCLGLTNCIFQTGTTALGRSPTVWIGGGTSSSLRISDCIFGGGGPQTSLTMTSIADNGATFAVATSGAHGFAVDDLVVIRNSGVAAYNSMWRISNIGSATIFSVTAALGAGNVIVSVADCVQSVGAAFLVENSAGTTNECVISNCLTTRVGGAANLYGTAGMFFDGKRSAVQEINGWEITGCWQDYGAMGILISGTPTSGSCTTYGFTISGGKVSCRTRGIHLDQVLGVSIDGFHANPSVVTSVNDGISSACGLYVFGGTNTPSIRGISVTNCHLGVARDFDPTDVGYLSPYGVILDTSMNLISIQGNQIVGSTAPFQLVNTPLAATATWRIKDNIASIGVPITDATSMPTITSATSIAATVGYDVFNVSGTTNIATITNGWVGRTVTLCFASALSLATGGNLAVSANRLVKAGDAVSLTFNGTSWYVENARPTADTADITADAATQSVVGTFSVSAAAASGSFTQVGSTINITTTGGKVFLPWSAALSPSTTSLVEIVYRVDDGADNYILYESLATSVTRGGEYYVGTLSAAAHTVKIFYRTASGTITISPGVAIVREYKR